MKLQAVWALCVVLLVGLTAWSTADDAGYFLSWQQKKELISEGRIQDSAGNWYDVWICPGYYPPARYAGEHLREAGGNFHEYLEANKYRAIKHGSKACVKWAFEECGLGFTVKGIPRAWNRHFSVAHQRTQRRVFGWWLAYPWAFLESTVETAFRGVVGTAGTVGGVATGVGLVPAYNMLDSAVVGVWNLGVNTVVIPAVGVTWNTVVAPPLALAGQKPSPSRVDGFWVTMGKPEPVPARAWSAEELERVGSWGERLFKEARPFYERIEAINAGAREHEARLQKELQTARSDANRQREVLQNEEKAHIRQLLETETISGVASNHPRSSAFSWEDEQVIRRHLISRNIPGKDAAEIVRLLRLHGAPIAGMRLPVRDKTDPLRRGVEVIGESAEDMMFGK